MADDKRRGDEVGLPLPPAPPPPGDPRVHPAAPPTFAPEFPPDFRSRRVDASDAPPEDDWRGRMPHGPPLPPPPSTGWRAMGFAVGAALVLLFVGIVGFLLLKPAKHTTAHSPEQTIELPPGQRLIHAEIGDGGQVYYRYAPLQPEEQPRSSTLEGRSSTGASLGTIHFIERAAE